MVERFYRRVIRITAMDSPNVRWNQAQADAGRPPDGAVVVPGVLPWAEYVKRRATWDAVRQRIGLDAEFWEGADALLFPPHWLDRCQRYADVLWAVQCGLASDPRYASARTPDLEGAAVPSRWPRRAEGVGCDPAEGGDSTALCAVDRYGVLELLSAKTPDTSVIRHELARFARRHLSPRGGAGPDEVPWDRVCLDRGGGGKQIADEMRARGMAVRTVGFGEPVGPDMRRNPVGFREKFDKAEDRYAYKNRRAEMYGELSALCDPALNPAGFAIPRRPEVYARLREQLGPLPRLYDGEGRIYLPPKRKKGRDDKTVTLTDMIGHSPDEADALALAVHAMKGPPPKPQAGGYVG